jgi:hypothetical protein
VSAPININALAMHGFGGNTSSKQSITSKNSTLIPIFEEIAYTVLRMAWRMKRFHGDALANFPCFAVGRRFCD